MNCYANDNIEECNDSTYLSTGKLNNLDDSVLIAYDDLRIVNAKLIELDYEKQINTNLRAIIKNDSIVIERYNNITETLSKDCKKAIKQRNILIGGGALLFVSLVISLLK